MLLCWSLWKQSWSWRDWALVAGGIVASVASSRLDLMGDVLELHATPWLAGFLLVLAGLRWYVPAVVKAVSVCWLTLLISDFLGMLKLAAGNTDVHLPEGIGGAGVTDALVFEPMMVALGFLLLKAAREHEARRKTRRSANA